MLQHIYIQKDMATTTKKNYVKINDDQAYKYFIKLKLLIN